MISPTALQLENPRTLRYLSITFIPFNEPNFLRGSRFLPAASATQQSSPPNAMNPVNTLL